MHKLIYVNRDNWAKNTSPNKNVKVYIGAPASSTAAGSGYVDINTFTSIIQQTKATYSSFGGVMFWDASQAYGATLGAIVNSMISLTTILQPTVALMPVSNPPSWVVLVHQRVLALPLPQRTRRLPPRQPLPLPKRAVRRPLHRPAVVLASTLG